MLSGTELELLDLALTHRSYTFETEKATADNERLEFLGDAVLGALAAEYLYSHYPKSPEGELSKMKAYVVSRKELGKRARELGLAELLLLGHGEAASGGAQRLSTLGSALEAVVGAVYLSADYSVLRRFVGDYLVEPVREALANDDHLDYKSQLQEIAQQTAGTLPEYRKIGQEGPPHKRLFTVDVYLGDRKIGTGSGPRIKTAENNAAREACKRLREK